MNSNATTTMNEKVVILSLTINSLGNHKKVDAHVETAAEKSTYNVTKKIMEAPELQKMRSLEGEIRRYVEGLSLPSPFKNGTYSMPIALMLDVDTQLDRYAHLQASLVDELVDALPRIEAEMRDKQKDLFRFADFPTAAKVRGAFGVDWGFVQLSTPTSLKDIDSQLFKREQEKIARQWEETMADMQEVLLAEMKDLTEHMVERLTPEKDGKKKIFRDTLVSNFTDFLKTFDARNITDNEQLKELAGKARMILDGIEPEDLRDRTSVRTSVQRRFAEMKKALDTMVIDRPKRGIEFGD